jgi:hypothetical protein
LQERAFERGKHTFTEISQDTALCTLDDVLARAIELRNRMRMTLALKGVRVVEKEKFRRRFLKVLTLPLCF